VKRVVLALHSWELFALLAAIAWWTGASCDHPAFSPHYRDALLRATKDDLPTPVMPVISSPLTMSLLSTPATCQPLASKYVTISEPISPLEPVTSSCFITVRVAHSDMLGSRQREWMALS